MNVFEMELKRDRNGRIVEKTETVAGTPATWKYTYDNGGRLTEAHRDGRLICQCHYDREGRRSRDYFPATVGPHYRDYQYTTDNRLLRAGNNTYTHNDNGFRSIWSSGGTYHLYEYTPDYRLLRMEVEDQNRVYTFQHNKDGQRAAKYLNGQLVEAYLWLDFIRLGTFHDRRMGYEFDYTDKEWLPSSMRREDRAVFTLHYDQVGSLRVVADSHGNVIKEVLYNPFGGIIEDTNPGFRVPIGFAGGLHDCDLGFVRFGWRDYDVNTGRWTAPDPIGDKGGDPDWYGYCLDDPVNAVDPLGLNSFNDFIDDSALSLKEKLSWRDVYIWRANEGACKQCSRLDGTLQENADVGSQRTHPNCKCTIEVCREGLESDDWQHAYEREPHYEVYIKASNLTGAAAIAIWKRVTPVVERKACRRVRICPSEGKTILGEETLYRETNQYETQTTKATCWVGRGDASEPGICTANNPWTGETTIIER